jgi:hypothetical protein
MLHFPVLLAANLAARKLQILRTHPPLPAFPCLSAVADHVRATVTGRQQRQRKQSRWLQETFDPNAGGCQTAGRAGRTG